MKKVLWLVGMAIASVMTVSAQEDYPAAPPSPQPIVKAEYFFDTDPGFGNGTAIPLTPSVNISNLAATINLTGSALTNGTHYLYLRTQDGSGRWSLVSFAYFDNFLVPAYPSSGNVVSLSAAEYFIDTDPGIRNGISVPLPSVSDASNVSVLINLLTITPGVHRLYLRTKDENGKWSITNYALFDNNTTIPYPTTPSAPPVISQTEYYIDNDPGFGNGMAINTPSSSDISNFSFSIPLSGISQGLHTIYLRSKQNPWSMAAYAEFLVGSTLPVQWLYVKGEVKGNDAFINWATGEEQNTDKFIIEYSSDGVQFSQAGKVTATGNANGSSYSFQHINAGSGAIWYRIKQVDKDGRFTYSKNILLVFLKDKNSLTVFPNPASEIVHVSLPQAATTSTITVYDINGRIVYLLTSIPENRQVVSIPILAWRNGVYYLSLDQGGKKQTLQLLKQ